ncbi:uncharacterized protein [Mytilus edulis]|uniref:uncharacterized protein isoform X9 n=1 Tax=Mytilus edulis TaxID=6550 RepID=UPI0039F01E1D
MAARHGVFLLLLVIVIQTVASKGMLMFLLSASQRKVICEDSKTTLSCPWNQVIKITQATYGRSDKRTCKHPNMKTTRCVTKKPLGISRKNCNGRTSCTVAANNRLYGDPCPGTYKYVTVTYSCKVKKTPKCLRRCHKQAKCIRGKCVCKSGYKGDGIRSCTNIKESAYIGCYQDHSKRILPKDVLTDKSMTVQKCRQFCRKKGFKFAGVENGNECFCGDVLRKNKQRKEGDCKTPCSGNKQQICGGPWRISIYTAQTSKCRTKCHKKAKCRKGKCVCKGNYQGDGVKSCKKVKQSAYIGCYEDHSKRILPKDVLTDKSMTVQKCRQFCRKKGFKYAGVENGNECFCGDVLRKNKKKREGDCKTPCSGNKQQICGGPWRISIYTAQISKCRNKCHKKAKCRKGKCVCKGNYQGDGVKSCKKVKPSKRKVICEDSKTTLSCPSNQVIKITQATYGRSNKRTCKHPNMKTTRCVTKKPLGISRKNCNGRKSCTIAANNRLYGDPCPGTYKYVTVTYSCKVKKTPKCLKRCHRQAKCIRGKCVCKSGYKGDGIRSCTNIKAGKRKVICEDSKTTLSCPSNQVIKITQATYGRSNKRTCKHPNMKTTRCVTKKPLGISRKNCNGRKSCIVAANNRLYGDPCPGTYKYVTVTYSCKVKKTPKCLKRCHKQAKCIRGKCVCKSGYKGDGIRSCTNIKAKTPCKPKCQMGFVCNFLGKCRPKGCKRKCRINERCVRGKCRCKKGSHRTKLVACRTKIQCTPKCKRRLVCSSLVKCTKGCKRKCRINERCFKGKCRCTKGSFRTKLGTCKKSAYVGCYQDHSKRILPKDFLRDKSMTVQKCQQFCRKKGFKYAGVENGNECFCGDVLRKNKKRKEGDCKTPCSGNKQQICGGPWRISIYTAQTSKCRNKCHKKAKCRKGKCVCKGNYQGDGVKSCKKVKQSAYIGCYQDHSKRILPKDVLTDKSMTVQKCRQFCRKKGFKYAGVENGNECFCGDVLRKNKKKREGDCKTPCSGNKQQICGGPWRISIYTAQISKCRNKCHKKAKCRKGKCVCKGNYQGDGVKSCKKVKPSKRKVICEDSKTTLSCPSNQVIKITQATYGRSNKRTCKHPNMKTTRCVTKKPLGISRKNCNGRKSCTVAANNRLYGDPCPGTYKYVTVTYSCKVKKTPKCLKRCHRQAKCIRGKCVCKSGYKGDGIRSCTNIKAGKRKVICEDSKTTLSCPSNQVIKITQATYGRSNKRTCKHPNMKTNRCVTKKPLGISRKNCNGRKSCIVAANNRLYGDPCPGTYKYVTVTYSCKVKKTPKCLKRCHKQAKCIRGKCVCKSGYKGDGIRSCTNIKAKTPCKPKCQMGFVCNFLGKCRPKGCKRKCRINERCVRGKCRCKKGSHRTKLVACRTKIQCTPKCKRRLVCSSLVKCTKGCKRKCRINERCFKGKCRCTKGSFRTKLGTCKKSAYVGCYQDHSKRILPKDFLRDKSMSVQKCQQFCRKKGFKYAGVENGNECFCGDVLRKNKKRKEGDCKTPCSGNKQQICGGPWRISIYTAQTSKCRNKCHKKAKCRKGKCVCKGNYQGDGVKSCKKVKQSAYIGCYQDHSKRILPKDVLTDKSMTVQKCRQFCRKKGFKYAGVENGNECFCGDVLRKNKKKREGDCKTPCSGNKQQICGGPWRISIYTAQISKCRNKCHKKAKCRKGKCVCKGNYQGDGVKSCKKVKQSAYIGCYQDHSKRILPKDVLTDKSMTVQKCRQFCRKKRFKYAGVENGNECFCGDVLRKNKKRKEGDCKTPCSGNKQQICGGPWRISIYTAQISKCRNKCHKKAKCRKGKCVCKGNYQGDGVKSCKKVKPSKRKVICEDSKTTLSCPSNQVIKITQATYGRSNKRTCKHPNMKTTRCVTKKPLGISRKNCNGRKSCTVAANNRLYGDPCPGTYKYVTVTYSCKVKKTPKCLRRCHRQAKCIRGKCVCKSRYKGDGIRSCTNIKGCKRKCRIIERCVRGKCRCKKGSYRTKLGACRTKTPCKPKCQKGFVCNFRGKCRPKGCKRKCRINERCVRGKCRCTKGSYRTILGACRSCERKCKINERCFRGKCRCNKGLVRTKLGACKTKVPCKPKCKSGFVCSFRGKCRPKGCKRKCRLNERCDKGKCRCKKGSYRTTLRRCKPKTPCKPKCKSGFVCSFRGKCRPKACKRKCRINERCRKGKCRCKKGSLRTKLGTCKTMTPCKRKCKRGFVCNFRGKCKRKVTACKRKCRINERCRKGKCRCKKGSFRTKLGTCKTMTPCKRKCKRGFVCNFRGKCKRKVTACKRKCRINERCRKGKCRCKKGSFRTKLGTCKTMTPCKRKCKRGFVCNFRGKCKRKVTACKRKCRINERCRKGKCRCKKGSFRTKLGTCKMTACKRKCRINERCRKGKCRCKKGSFRTKLGTCKTMTPCTRKCKRGFVCNFRGKCKRKVTACKRKCRINERCRKGKCRCKKGSFRTKLGTCKTMTPCKRKCKRGFVCNFRGKCKRKVTACKRKCRINERCRKGKCRCKKGSFRTKLGTCKTMTPCKRKCKRGFVCNFRGKCKRKVTACKRKCRINERCRKGKCRCKKGSFRTKLGTCKTMTPCTRKCKRGFVCNFRGKCKRKVTACKRKCRINERCRKGKCRCKKGSFRTKLGTCKTMTPCTRKCKRGFVCNFRGKCKRKVTACKRKCRINERCRKGKCRCKKGSFRTKLGTCKTMTPCKRKCKRGFVCNFRGKCKRKVTACIRKCRINERCRKGKCRCKKGSFRTKLGTCKTMTPCKRKCKRGFVCNFRGKCKRKECKRKCRINERCVRGKYRCKKGSYRTKLGTCRTKTPCKPKCQKGFVCNFLGKCRPKGCKRKCRINERCVRGKCRCKKGSYRTKLGACRTKIQCTPKCKRGFVCSFLGKCRPKGCKRKCRINERCFNGKCRCTKGSFRTKLGTCKKRCNADSCGVNAVCVKRKDCRCKRGYAGHPKILCEEVKECLKNARGKDYNGRMSTTESGRTCQAWNKQTPHRHSKSNVRDAKNYCRNMDNEQRPWCYTTDSRKRWEFCRIPICENRVPILPPPEECRKSTKGTEYKGRISLTKTGRTCQYWERQYPHKHRFSISFKKEHNYCRNPDNSGQPWCYTNDPTTRWEYCQIPMCAPEDQEDVDECRKSTKGTEYKGRISLTKTGRTCQYWERQYPHKHRFSISFKKEHNYCRNPDNSGQPWCYTNDPTKRWEYCQIPMCAACSVREEIVECKATVRVSGSCFYKSKVGSSCVYTVQLTNSQAIIKTSTQEMVLTNGGNLAECAIFTFNDGTLKIEDDVCKCFEATVVNK